MKKISIFIVGLMCAAAISAQKLYFSPQTDWGAAGAKFNACLKSGNGTPTILYLAPVEGQTNLFSADLANTAYDQICFLRLAPTDPDVAENDTWGWNKTGYMPFSYAEGNYWAMNTAVWDAGANDKSFFSVGTLNFLYFTPTYSFEIAGDNWEQFNADNGTPVQSFNVVLINSSTSNVVFLFLNPTQEAHKYSVALSSTNFDKIRFYRVPPGETISNQDWGWNKTGEMSFNYADCNHYVMTESVWTAGTNDYQYFECGANPPSGFGVVSADANIVGYYSVLGAKLPQEPQSGVYIIKYDNGKTEKIVK